MKTKDARTSDRVERIVRQSRASRMFAILTAADGSLDHVEAHGLLRIRAEANERRAIHAAMSRGPQTSRQFQTEMWLAMRFQFATPFEEIGGELRWRCNHRCGFRDGYCWACEMNEIYQSDQHLAARRVHRAGVRRDHWKWLAGMWSQLLDY